MADALAPTSSPSSGTAAPSWEPESTVRGQNVTLVRALSALQGRSGRILEVGAGTARFLRALRQRVSGLEGHACDLSRPALNRARHHDGGLHVTQGDLTALPYRDNSFDTVVAFDIFEHLYDPGRGLVEVWRVLKPGGQLHALVPCEGQPLTLHWLMWKANIGADLKEKSVGHVQRFTHASLQALLEQHGFERKSVSYSMHPIGQVKDILMHLEQGPEFSPRLRRNPFYRALSTALWGGAYLESWLLRGVPLSAVALHVTASKPCASS